MSVLNDTQKMELERRLDVMKSSRNEMLAATDKLDKLAASKRLLAASNNVNEYLEELTGRSEGRARSLNYDEGEE